MPNQVTIRVVSNDFPAITKAMQATAEVVVAKAAMDLEAQMKVRAPVRTGFLRASVQGGRVGPRHWRVVVGADYGAHVNYGTRNMAPRPFVEPAVEIVRPAFIAAMRKVVG